MGVSSLSLKRVLTASVILFLLLLRVKFVSSVQRQTSPLMFCGFDPFSVECTTFSAFLRQSFISRFGSGALPVWGRLIGYWWSRSLSMTWRGLSYGSCCRCWSVTLQLPRAPELSAPKKHNEAKRKEAFLLQTGAFDGSTAGNRH